MFWLFPIASAEPPPRELIGTEATPVAPVACELHVEDHDAVGTLWSFRVELSAPDDKGVSTVQRVTSGVPGGGVPTDQPVAAVAEVDATQRLADPRLSDDPFVFVAPRTVDWSVWPLMLSFLAPRADDDAQLGAFSVTVNEGATRADWGSCILTLNGPGGVGGCTILTERRGTCLVDYVARHRLGPP